MESTDILEENEIWRNVTLSEFEHFFMVSNFGRVKNSVSRKGVTKGRVLGQKKKCGYFKVMLSTGKERTLQRVARLVALAFIPNPDNKQEVNHINGIKTDNRIKNLEWCTHSENMKHAAETRLMNHPIHSEEYKEEMSVKLKKCWMNQYSRGDKE